MACLVPVVCAPTPHDFAPIQAARASVGLLVLTPHCGSFTLFQLQRPQLSLRRLHQAACPWALNRHRKRRSQRRRRRHNRPRAVARHAEARVACLAHPREPVAAAPPQRTQTIAARLQQQCQGPRRWLLALARVVLVPVWARAAGRPLRRVRVLRPTQLVLGWRLMALVLTILPPASHAAAHGRGRSLWPAPRLARR